MDDSTRMRGYIKELIDCDAETEWAEDDGRTFCFTVHRLDREITFRLGLEEPYDITGCGFDSLSIVSDAVTVTIDDTRTTRRFELDYDATACREWTLHVITRGWLARWGNTATRC